MPRNSFDLDRDFLPLDLKFDGQIYENIFAKKNNKTMAETIIDRRYKRFAEIVREYYTDYLNVPLGYALFKLKQNGDAFYKSFLNPYGDERYCVFSLLSSDITHLKGVYAFFADEQLRYIGRCKDSIEKRIKQGYGKIHPKNCYVDGQSTNCRINAEIAKASEKISLRFMPIENDSDIEWTERILIRQYNPRWNIQNT